MAQEPTLWRWRVSESDQELVHGYATSRESAQIDGDNALFKLLSLGAQWLLSGAYSPDAAGGEKKFNLMVISRRRRK